MTSRAQQFRRSFDEFALVTPGVRQAIVVSNDGLLLAMSGDGDLDDGERFGAVTSAMSSLAAGVGDLYRLGRMRKLIVDLDGAFLLLSAFGQNAWLGVVAERDSDLGTLARDVQFYAATSGVSLSRPLAEELRAMVVG